MRARLAVSVAMALAACGPRWTLEDRTTSEVLGLAPQATHEAAFAIEASHPIPTVRTVAEGISVKSGALRVEQRDLREGCSASRDFEGRDGTWKAVDGGTATFGGDRLELSASCPATERATEVRVRITNQGPEAVTLRWFVVAITNGEGGEDPPGDAFVRVRPVNE